MGGQDGRFWSGDYVRFVDAYAVQRERSFTLDPDQTPSELLIATSWDGSPLHFLVESSAPQARLTIDDWGTSETYEIDSGASVITWEPSAAWRRHRFWWNSDERYRARTIRMKLEESGSSSEVSIRYLGDGAQLQDRFRRRLPGLKIPETAVAGTSTTIPIHVRNMSSGPWSSDSILPVQLRYWLRPEGSTETIDGPVTPLPERVRRGQVLQTEMEVVWPQQPGIWELEIDLELSPVARFSEHLGKPLARSIVEVVESP